MGIKADFVEAEQIIAGLRPADHLRLRRICDEVQAAEANLLKRAANNMDRCIKACEGLCCRNIQLEAIIGVWDLVYILTVAEAFRDRIAACLERGIPFYAAACILLKDGVGPCIFPSAVRAEVCLTTFGSRTKVIEPEIRQVKREFYKLGWFLATCKPRMVVNCLRRPYEVKP